MSLDSELDELTHGHVFLGDTHDESARRTLWVVLLTAGMMLVEIVACEFTGKTKFSANGLADTLSIQGSGKWVGETVRDCAVVFVAKIVGSDVVVSFFYNRAK